MKLFAKIEAQIIGALSSIIFWLLLGTIVYHSMERWNWIQSFYFAVTTLTTVGMGDLHPTSDISRLFTSFYILFGTGMVLASLGVIGANFLNIRERRIIKSRGKRKDDGK